MSKIRKKPLLLFLVLLAALYVLIYIIPTVTGAMRTTYTAEYGRLQVYDEQKGYLVRTEAVYTATESGDANRYIDEGELVQKGTHILKMVASTEGSDSESEGASREFVDVLDGLGKEVIATKSYTSKSEGVVAYSVDGLEAELTPETMRKKSRSDYESISQSGVLELHTKNIQKGDPVYKICDRMHWYIVCFIPKDHKDRYSEGATIKIRLDSKKTIRGTVDTLKASTGGKYMLIVETSDYYSNFAKERIAEVKTITSDASGLLILNASISEKDGQKGVYVRQKNGEYQFTPIRVITTDGEYSVISHTSYIDEDGNTVKTVSNYDEILKRGR